MSNHLKRFTNHDNYNAHISTGAAVLPNVCVCDNESEIHYNELKLITFEIGNVQYQAEEGMTWEDWVNSKYNIDNDINKISIHNNYVYNNYGTSYQGSITNNSSEIIQSIHYYSVHDGGSND